MTFTVQEPALANSPQLSAWHHALQLLHKELLGQAYWRTLHHSWGSSCHSVYSGSRLLEWHLFA